VPGTLSELPPYELDELVVWTFQKGMAHRGGPGAAALAAISTPVERLAFTRGIIVGVGRGASDRLSEEIAATLEH
jgi:hypothetical protein